jgi:preprotein translocase subunit YajC
MILAAGSTHKGGGSPVFLLGLLLLFGIFYFVMIRPQRNRQRQAVQMQRQVLPGQRIITTAGVYATVVSGDDQTITVEIAPGVQIKMMRRAVLRQLADDEENPSAAAGLNGQVTDEAPQDSAPETAPPEPAEPAEHPGTED